MSKRVAPRRGHEGSRTAGPGHLWAIGYDDMERAAQVKDEIIKLGWDQLHLNLLDVAVVMRRPDGTFTLDREPFPAVANVLGSTGVGFVAGLVPAAPRSEERRVGKVCRS